MAQLKNTVVQGSLKATDTIYSSTGQFQIIKAPTSSGGSTYGPGTNGQVLKSNGSSVYWASDNNSDTQVTQAAAITTAGAYPLILANSTATTAVTGTVNKTSTLTYNPNTKALVTGGTVDGYTLNTASAKGVIDSSSASAIGTGTSLPTERDIYYGLPTINNAHNYTSSSTYYAPTTAGTAGQFLKAAGGTSAPTWNNIYYSDIKPAIKKTYASTSYYATAANDNAKSAFYFMNIRPNDWNKPWSVKFKVHSFCPNYSSYQSTTVCTLSGRQQDIIYSNWNEQINAAHNYISMLRLKSAGYNAGLGHAVGINILNGGNYTNSNYYRTFEVEYYECDACEVTLLDAPVLQANWSNYNTTNYNTVSNYDASSRGDKHSGDNDNVTSSRLDYFRLNTGSVGIGRYTLFMQTSDGTYQSITSTFNNQGTSHVKNTALFRPERVFYRGANSDIAANNSTNNDGSWVHQQTTLIDLRWSTNCGKTLVARQPVYLVGTIDANGFFSLADTWWTQTEPTTENNKVYIYLGVAYPDDSTTTNAQYRIALELDNPIYWYKNGSFVLYESPYLFSKVLANTDLDTLTSDAIYKRRLYSLFGAGGNGCTNLPINDGEAFGLLSYPTASGFLTQELSSNANTIGKWLRWYSATSNTWTAWQKVITDSTGDFTKRVWVAASPGYLRIIDNQYFSDNRAYLDFTIGSTSGKQGILSSGYYTKADRSAFVENSKWLVYRDVGGDVYLNGSAQYLMNLGRLTSANLDSSSAEYLNKAFVFYASGSMTEAEGHPAKDSVIFHCSWDNSTWASQLALPINRATDRSVQWRGSDNIAWGDWRTLLDSNNYTDYTVTKTGTGASGTWSITADKATKDANGLNISTSYLKLSGGTLTGDLIRKGSVVDASKTNNNITGSATLSSFTAADSADRRLGRIESIVQENGNIGLHLYVRNYDTSGAQVQQKGILMMMDKTGNLTYTISDKANFVAALEPYAYYVTQSNSTTANWRKIVLGYQSASSSDGAVNAASNEVYVTRSIEAQPSTGTLRATNYRVANNVELQWNSTDSSLDFVFI